MRRFKGLTLRQRVFDRDRGVCSACGLRTQAIAKWGFEVQGLQFRGQTLGVWTPKFRKWERRMIKRGRFSHRLPEHRITIWDADHILARVDGGSDRLENLRTLCWWHHDQRTGVQAGARAVARAATKGRNA
jgi:hypothetical protein